MSNTKNADNLSTLNRRHRLSFLAKDSLLYGGAAAFSKAFSLITFPILTRHFSVEEYGMISLFTAVAGLLTTLFIFGQDSAVARYFYEYKAEEDRKKIISQSLLFQMFILAVTLPILWIFTSSLAHLLHTDTKAPLVAKIILLHIPFMLLINFSQNLLKWTFARIPFLIVSVGSVAINLLFLLVGVFVFRIDVVGLFLVSLSVQMVFGFLGLFFVRRWITKPDGFGFLRELIPFAIPYGIICIAGSFLPVLERALVNSMLGSEMLGLYSAAAAVAMHIMLFTQAFQTAWGPFYMAIHKEPDAAQTYSVVLKGFVLMICIFLLFLSAVAEPVIKLLATDRYVSAAIVIFPLSMGLAIQGIGWITEIGVGLSKKSHLALYSYISSIVATGITIYFMAHVFGLVGVALGVMTGHIVKTLIATGLAQRVYPMKWPFLSVLTVVLSVILMGLIGITITPIYGSTVGSVFFLSTIPITLVIAWFGMFTRSERISVKSKLVPYIVPKEV